MASKLQVKTKIEVHKSIKIAPFKKEIRKTTPHLHNNYFEILYLSEGSGHHFIDSRRYDVKPPVIFFVRKEQVHFWELDKEPEGFVAIIKKSFTEKSLDNELKLLLTKLSSQNCLYLKDTLTIQPLFQLLAQEYTINGEHSFSIIEGLLKALLAKIVDIAMPVIHISRVKPDLYHSFLEMLRSDNVVRNSVQYYAELLNTSPQNLNAACRKASDQSATEVLSEFITSEAKRLLLYTDNTVSQIAFTLGFIDASHFGKYFKRITGQTPQTFRVSNE